MKPNTHLAISHALCGSPGTLSEGGAQARLITTKDMSVDQRGLVHGGFIFGLADHAAMLAVNDPNVVLGSAETRFVAPVRVGAEVVAMARILENKGKKRVVEVVAKVGDQDVLTGTMTAFVLDRHVFDQ